jgi:hypothetical protein
MVEPMFGVHGEHQWGGKSALPDFNGEHVRAMLPPLLKQIFAPDPPKPRKEVIKPKPLVVIKSGKVDDVLAQLAEAKARFPEAEVRSGPRGTWKLWPAPDQSGPAS